MSDDAPSSSCLIPVAALFQGTFSIDWLVELTDLKPSYILFALEEGIQERWLSRVSPGKFNFVDNAKKIQFQQKLPTEQLCLMHSRIGKLLIKDLQDSDEKAIQIATHLLKVENDEENCRWLLKAADRYIRTFQTTKSIACYTKIQEDLKRLTGHTANNLYIETAIQLSKISVALHNTTGVITFLKEALKRAENAEDRDATALLEMHLAKNYWLHLRSDKALEHFRKGSRLARQSENLKLKRSANTFNTFFYYWQGKFKQVIDYYEKIIPDVERSPQGGFPLLASITVGLCYVDTGQITQGLGMVDAIHTFCVERGDSYFASAASGTLGLILLSMGKMEEAQIYIKRSLKEANKSHNDYMLLQAKGVLAFVHYLNGQPDKARSYLRDFILHCRKVNVTASLHMPHVLHLCWAMENNKLPLIAELSLDKEIETVIHGENVFLKGIAFRYSALLARNKGKESEEIFRILGHSMDCLEISGHQVELNLTRMEMARQHLLDGSEKKARQYALDAADGLKQYNDLLIADDLRPLIGDQPTGSTLLNEILTLGQQVVTIRDTKEVAKHILSTANRITGAERGALFLLDSLDNEVTLRLRASKNLTGEQVMDGSFAASMKLIESVAATGKEQHFLMDTDSSGEKASVGDGQIRSCICVPMALRGQIVGVLYHDNRLLGRAFKSSDLDLVAFFAAQAAFALDNANAYEEIRCLNQQLQDEKSYYMEQLPEDGVFQEIIGQSAVMMNLQTQIAHVAPTDATVLILGETGVGKELVANAIHWNSPRKNAPFVRSNCSALTPSLINSELFGHEKGAFTGANVRRLGRFEMANGGTLFLDEIGDLPMDVQVSLLRVIQSGEFERVGGSETLKSDFRLVVATNRNLEKAVKAKQFRADLFYRLNVFPIEVPPLRKRREDIPLLMEHFIKIYGKKMNKPAMRIPQRELNRFMRYHWPGNVRELENAVERGVILSRPSTFKAPNLFPDNPADQAMPHEDSSLAENERRHILWALEKTGWKIRGKNGTAELLDIHPSTLAFRMKKHEIQRPPKRGGNKQ